MIDLSVVVTSWNTRELTLSCVERVCECLARAAAHPSAVRPASDPQGDGRLRWELVVVDNGSHDGTVDALGRQLARDTSLPVRVMALDRNLGFAAANNRALAQTQGGFVLLLNSDAQLTAAAVETCLATFATDPAIAFVGPQLLHPDGRRQNSLHAFPSLWTEAFPLALLETLFPRRYPSKRRPVARPIEVEAVQGAALFARRSALEAIGPLSEDYFFFLEETDWCWRARAAGFRVVFEPRAELVHAAGASSKAPHPGATAIEFHRSLYHFLGQRRGPGTRRVAQGLRFARALLSLGLLALRAPWSERAAHRLRGRRAVLRWHLAGCPAAAGLRVADLDAVARTGNPAVGEARMSGGGHA